MKVYPTKFEAYEEPDCCDSLFSVEAFDEVSAAVKMDTVVTVASWDEIAVEVRKCLVRWNLRGENGNTVGWRLTLHPTVILSDSTVKNYFNVVQNNTCNGE